MAYFPNNLGQQPMSSSRGVVIASDQTPVSVAGTLNINPSSVLVLNPVSILAVNPNPASVQVLNPVSVLATTQSGIRITSLVSIIPSSVIVGASIFGQLPAGTAPLGSVATLQGTNPWIVNFQNSSILAVPVGSVITVLQAPSIVGTYAEDAAHTTADKGIFVLGVRNDAIASFVGANLEYGPQATDSAGRSIIKPFTPDESAFRFSTSVVSGSVTLVQASAIGKRSYITDFWLINSGSVATLVTWRDGSTSVVGYAVAPAGTGANSPGINVPLQTAPSQDLTFFQAPSASILYVTVAGYQSP